jgi:threonylcarbamoyladenosine tRNA methylthiotransferase MtaB
MPHFHLALQAGSAATLTAMRRRYTVEQFRDAAARIRAAVPGVAITTDVIAGFPGETDADFDETIAFCDEMGFARLHCFPYSHRAGTAANRMPAQVTAEVRKARMTRLLALGTALRERFLRAQAGRTLPVLWEEERDVDGERLWFGHTPNYVPVYARGEGLRNRITPVTLGQAFRDGVLASEGVAP